MSPAGHSWSELRDVDRHVGPESTYETGADNHMLRLAVGHVLLAQQE